MSTQLKVHIGNHLESLAMDLAHSLRQGRAENRLQPFDPEVIMVQSKGMQRWISMAIARHNGICANMEFPFPNAFLEKTYSRCIGPLPDDSPFNSDCLTFRIMSLIMDRIEEAPFAMLRNYLSGENSELKAFQLSRRLADIFDQYLVFRPDMLNQWESNENMEMAPHEQWQAILWKMLTDDTTGSHRADLQRRLVDRLLDSSRTLPSLPGRISVFGISHLPPFHLKVLEALAHRIPVNLFLLNPCREYWADIVSDQQMIKVRSRVKGDHSDLEDLHYDRGNRLLASWGHQGRQFFGLIHQLDGEVVELFEENTGDNLLQRIQQDILDLVDRPSVSPGGETMAPDDSLRINVCHSPMREIEVLHDHLLEILDSRSDIYPGDILVMTPDIARYAPYIHGVFGAAGDLQGTDIPYTVADQTLPEQSRLVEGFLQVLQIRKSRFEVSRILDLLAYRPIRERFGLEVADLPQVEQWIRDTGIRWGWDAEDRKSHGLPGFRENTWRVGLDRLLMGYAMAAESDTLCAGLLPHADIEAGQGEMLGRLVHFAETLHNKLVEIPDHAPLGRWPTLLEGFMESFLDEHDRYARDLQALRDTIASLRSLDSQLDATGNVSFEIILAYLSDRLGRTSHGTGFMAGSVTFCAMLPMRSIPAKVICILGMQHDAFPQDLHEPDFNLIVCNPRPGDRSKRNDDKYLFLEALLSARNIFYLSYIGRDIQDNSAIPPSVLVSELVEYLTEGMRIPADQLITVHPLQAFSHAYFDGSNPALFSYSKENLEACQQLAVKSAPKPFFSDPLPPPDNNSDQTELASLISFFQHPLKYLLEQRLGIYLQNRHEVVQDREEFKPSALNRYHIAQTIFNRSDAINDAGDTRAIASASGRLPHGSVGQVTHDEIHCEVDVFKSALARHLPQSDPRTAMVEVETGMHRISGVVHNLYPQARVVYRLARIRPQDVLATFINHLVMQAASEEDLPRISILVGKDEVIRMQPVVDAAAELDRYMALFNQGLLQPLPLFPQSSHAYAMERIEKNKPREKAMATALKVWHGGYAVTGECLDPYVRLCDGAIHPGQPDFESLAIQVYGPLFNCLQRQKL